MRPGHRVCLALYLFAGVAWCLMARSAVAHAILLESSPSINTTVAGPSIPVKLRFNVRIDATRSRLTLVKPDASTQSLAITKDAPADTLASQAEGLSPGEYRIRWQVLASDGHITRGEIPFLVARP
ncbi:MAG TPA: copper resistance CopC family protein [Candidatus Acidoferrum sp.]